MLKLYCKETINLTLKSHENESMTCISYEEAKQSIYLLYTEQLAQTFVIKQVIHAGPGVLKDLSNVPTIASYITKSY